MAETEKVNSVMNEVIHHGLRRDLDRLDATVATPVPDDRRVAVCEHVAWLLDTLHHHHVNEDEGVWPRTLAKRPDLQELVDEMEAEHEALAAASDTLRAAAARYRRDGSDSARLALGEAVASMKSTTLPHLDHEEAVAMPLVEETLDEADWDYLDKNHFRKGVSFRDEGVVMMWLLDDLDMRRADVVKGLMPTPVMWMLKAMFGRAYDRGSRRRWPELAGTRA